MKNVLIILIFSLGPSMSWCEEGIPDYLVGVWASEDSKFGGQSLHKGVAVYLGSNGVGAIVGAPPTLGHKILATYDPESNTIHYKVVLNEKVVDIDKNTMTYNPSSNTLSVAIIENMPLHRKFDVFTTYIKEELGL